MNTLTKRTFPSLNPNPSDLEKDTLIAELILLTEESAFTSEEWNHCESSYGTSICDELKDIIEVIQFFRSDYSAA